jgi:hypothetical protein
MSKDVNVKLDEMAQTLENKLMEYETSIQTLATVLMCILVQNNDIIEISRDTVSNLVNREDFSEFDFEFMHLENGDAKIKLIRPGVIKDENDSSRSVSEESGDIGKNKRNRSLN